MAGKLLSETVQDSFVHEFSKANRTARGLGKTFFERLGWSGIQDAGHGPAAKKPVRRALKKK